MRYIHLFIAIASLALLTASCDRELPYPLDQVKRGVVIDVVRTAETDATLSEGMTDGNYKVTVSIPKQQGDYSSLDHAQLLCVFTGTDGRTSSKVVVDNIKNFPQDIAIDIAQVYRQFGKTAPALGESVVFTTNAVLKNGDIIYGWNEYSGFNNKLFTGWQVNGRSYSYSVKYPVVCRLVLDDFVGTVSINDPDFFEGEYEANITKISDTELELTGFIEEESPNGVLRIIVNPVTYTVSVTKQTIIPGPIWGYHDLSFGPATGEIDACNGMITLAGTFQVAEGSFGAATITIKN